MRIIIRAIPFEYTWGGGGGGGTLTYQKSWGEGVKMKKLGVYMKKIIGGGGGSEIVGVPPPMYFLME